MGKVKERVQIESDYIKLVELLVENKGKSGFSGQVVIVIKNGEIEQVRNFTIWGASNIANTDTPSEFV